MMCCCGLLFPSWATAAEWAGFARLEVYRGTDLPDDPQTVADSNAGWEAFDGVVSAGYRSSPLWIRAWAADQPVQPEWRGYTIRLGMPYLDDVRVYRRSAEGRWLEWVRGDRMARSAQGERDRMFLVPAAPAYEVMLIRVQSTSTLAVTLEHLSDEVLERQRRTEHGLLGLFMGLWVLLLLWSATNAVLYRDAVSGWFAAYEFSATLMGLALSGYSALMLPADFAGVSGVTSFTILLSTALGLIFHRSLLMELTVPHRLHRVMDATVILAGLNLGLLAVGLESLALRANAWLATLVMGIYLPAAFFMLMRPAEPGRRGVLVVYGILGVFILMSMLPVLGAGHFGVWSLYTTVTHSLLSGVTLGVLLLLRHSRKVKDAVENQIRAQAADLENRRLSADRDDKARLLSMLAHELRTPLSVLRMALESEPAAAPVTAAQARLNEYGRRAIRDMNDVIERTVQADRMERGEAVGEWATCRVSELVEVVCQGRADRHRVRVDVAATVPSVHSDAFLLKTLLGNLIDNALKYSPAESTVVVGIEPQCRAEVPGVMVTVRNSVGSAGRPDASRVFEKYYRSEGARRSTGSGLGLFLVQGLARRLGAEVHLRQAMPSDIVCFEVWISHESTVDHPR